MPGRVNPSPAGYPKINMAQKSRHSPFSIFITIILLIVMLVAIPITVVYLGYQTRTQSKAANTCKNPPVPDPRDCVGGQWRLATDENNCVHFRCQLAK